MARTAPPPPAATDPAADAADDTPQRRVTLGRIGAAIILAATAVMWIYVFAAEDDYHPAGWLKDRTFPTAAEAACKPFAKRLAELPAASTARTPAERADLVDRGTEILGEMQAALKPLVPSGKAGVHIGEWVSDWSTHIEDRNAFAAQLRKRAGAEFMETTKGGSQLSTVLDRFAEVNKMPSCVTGEDV